MILFSEDDQVLQEPFVKQSISKARFHLVPDIYYEIKFYILSRYTLVIILQRKYLCFSIVNYVSSSQAEVTKFATL